MVDEDSEEEYSPPKVRFWGWWKTNLILPSPEIQASSAVDDVDAELAQVHQDHVHSQLWQPGSLFLLQDFYTARGLENIKSPAKRLKTSRHMYFHFQITLYSVKVGTPKPAGKKLLCSLCKKVFFSRWDFPFYSFPFKCNLCPNWFSLRESFESHAVNMHGKKKTVLELPKRADIKSYQSAVKIVRVETEKCSICRLKIPRWASTTFQMWNPMSNCL